MADLDDESDSGIPSYQHGETGDARALLGQYADTIDHYVDYSRIAKSVSGLPAVIDTLNSQLDKNTSAFFAEYSRGTIYNAEGDDESWQPLSNFLIQGPLRPFIGDRLYLTSNGILLLVDTARKMGVADFVHLQIRSKEDAAVAQFSAEESIGAVQKVGEIARDREGDTQSVISRNRWGQEETDPSLE